jgi:hypothetical protein
MTTPNSPEAVADSANGSATYGTRSRGRNAPRPNYAEDRDLDVDMDASAPKAKRNSLALTNIVNGSNPEEKTSPAQRKSLTNGNGANGSAKDAIPGTSSFSARPDDVNGSNLRKRKQPASTPNSSSAAKKIFTSPPGDSDGEHFTNMMSFEDSGPYLKDGLLIADDGTTFGLNGLFHLPPSRFAQLTISRPCVFNL